MLGNNIPMFQCSVEAWEFVFCQDFNWPGGNCTETEWWEGVGKFEFPDVYHIAKCYLWVPPVLTQCDSIISIMGDKFNSRQTSLSPEHVCTQMFLHANLEHVNKLCGVQIFEAEEKLSDDQN